VLLTVQKFVDLLCLLPVKGIIGFIASGLWGDVRDVKFFIMSILCTLVSLQSEKLKVHSMKNYLYIHEDISLITSFNDKCFRPSSGGNQNTHFVLISSVKIVQFVR